MMDLRLVTRCERWRALTSHLMPTPLLGRHLFVYGTQSYVVSSYAVWRCWSVWCVSWSLRTGGDKGQG